MMEYLLEARGICKSYGDLVANDNINLAVSAGVIHALIGENGAGKSTLVNILYGTVSADAGSFFWRGREVKIDSPQTAREMGIGIVFQHFALFESLTVAENIALGAKTDGDFRALSEKYDLSIDRLGASVTYPPARNSEWKFCVACCNRLACSFWMNQVNAGGGAFAFCFAKTIGR